MKRTAPLRERVERLVNAYVDGLTRGDFSKVDFAANVSFMGPLMEEPTVGRDAVTELLTEVSEGVEDIRIQRLLVDGDNACAIIEFETTGGRVLPICDHIRISEDGIVEVRPYFDPRPLIEEAQEG